MDQERHEIPTHLNVDDKVLYGLTARQVLCLLAGASCSYALWNQSPDWSFEIRLGLAVVCLLVAAVVALVRPLGRGLEAWVFVLLQYAAMPKACIWLPAELPDEDRQGSDIGWLDLPLDLAWQTQTAGDRTARQEEHR